MKKLLKGIFILGVMVISLYISILFLDSLAARGVPLEISFTGGPIAEGELYYDALIGNPAYLCAQPGQTFFYEEDERISLRYDLSNYGQTGVMQFLGSEYGDAFYYGQEDGAFQAMWDMDGNSWYAYGDERYLEVPQPTTLTLTVWQYSGISHLGFNSSEETIVLSAEEDWWSGSLKVYTTGATEYTPVETYNEVNNAMAYVLAECENNIGAPRSSYVNVAFWAFMGSGGSASASTLTAAQNATPDTVNILERYKNRLESGRKLTDSQIEFIEDVIYNKLGLSQNSEYAEIIERYKNIEEYEGEESISVRESLIGLINFLISMLEDGETSSVVTTNATSLIQEASDFQAMWDRINRAGGYQNSVRDETNLSNVDVEYDSENKEYLVGPFNIEYIEVYSGGNQFAGMTGTPQLTVDEDGKTVNLKWGTDWNFEFKGSRPSGIPEEYNSYPHAGENFYIRLKYKEGRNALISMTFNFRYLTASASWTKSEGNIEKIQWRFNTSAHTCNEGTMCDGGEGRGAVPATPMKHESGTHYCDASNTNRNIPGHTWTCRGYMNENNVWSYHGPNDPNCNERQYTCNGHACSGGHECAHGFYERHFSALGVYISTRFIEWVDIQDIGTCTESNRGYEFIAFGGSGEKGDGIVDGSGYTGDNPATLKTGWNIDLTTTIAGNVWLENEPGKGESTNGINDRSEQDLENIGVTVYLYRQDGTNLGTAIHHDASGRRLSWPIYTDENGYYEVNRLEAPGSDRRNIDSLFYVVEFEYDGQVFKNTVYMSSSSSGNQGTSRNYATESRRGNSTYFNSSMAVETVHDRLAFDESFGVITGNSSIENDLSTTGITRTTNEVGQDVSGSRNGEVLYNGESENNRVTSELDSAALLDGNNVLKNDVVTPGTNYERYRMTARTYYDSDPDYNRNNNNDNHGVSTNFANFRTQYPVEGTTYVLNTYKDGNKRYIAEYMLHINLGLEKRTETDVSLLKDLYKVTLVVNEQKITKRYNSLPNIDASIEAGTDLNEFLISVEENRANRTYTLGLYESDLSYQSSTRYGNAINQVQTIKEGTELKVYATYVIRAYNNSETSDVEINEITDYYDETFTLITEDVETSIVNEDLKRANQIVAESPYYRIVPSGTSVDWKATKAESINEFNNGSEFNWDSAGNTNGMIVTTMDDIQNIKLQTGEYVEIYTTYEIDQDGYNAMTGGAVNAQEVRAELLGEKNNIAEVSSYSTYYSDLDMEAPRYHSYKEGNVSGRVDRDSAPNNIDRSNLRNRAMYEDDTYLAIPLGVEMEARSRDMYGYVWEDEATEELGKYELSVGDGNYNNEPLVPNVKVSLYEVINLGAMNENGDYDGTYDGMEYYYQVPSNLYFSTDQNGTTSDGAATTVNGKVKNIEGQEVNGNYYIGGFLAGDYILRFDYGTMADDKGTIYVDNVEQEIDVIKYNGQDYENTRFMGEISDDHLNDKYLDISGNTQINGTKTTDLAISKARDNESRRMVVNAYSRTIENYRGELLRDRNVTEGSDYEKIREEFINNTKMFAETPIMQVEIDNPEGVTNSQTPGESGSTVEKVSDGMTRIQYTIRNIGLGLEERAETDIALEHYISRIMLLKSDQPLLIAVLNEDGTVDIQHQDSAYLEKLTYLPHSADSLEGNQGFFSIDVENEYMNDLSLNIEYKVKVINNSEVDFTGGLAGYYRQEEIIEAASESPTTDLYDSIIRNIEELDENGIGISTNSTLAEVLELYGNQDSTIASLLNQNISNVSKNDTLRPEVIIYGRYVGRYYYENYLREDEKDYTISNYSYDTNAADISITYTPDKVVETTVDQVVDYIDINTSLNLDATTNIEDASWKLSKTGEADNRENVDGATGGLLKDLNGLISESAYKKVDGKVNLYDEKNREFVTDDFSNIAISLNETLGILDEETGMVEYKESDQHLSSYNPKLTRDLQPKNYANADGNDNVDEYTGEIRITTRKNTSSDEDANEMKMDNLIEILVYSNPTGRRDINSVPGNAMAIGTIDGAWLAGYNSKQLRDSGNPQVEILSNLPIENDAWATEYVTIVPPTGIALREFIQNNLPIVIACTLVIIGLAVIFTMKQIKIHKNRE